ncbi:GerAB/ArcD/ProY family transporter [Paenibacillus tyrfis]|uniref:GerAB/ArcD/ProY family transporter n=1 Tax=Paenibacillus tyrfis TaxID=1501230 RepID=UPI00209E33BB|nr:endospore germination permease [Paenibacillus tyrfis]MCP1308316.1 endospore germination permease [Paenibacillus tyrfis]
MDNDKKITVRQFLMMVILFSIGSSILFLPSGTAAYTKQGAWISIIAGMATGIPIILLFLNLARRYPDMTFVEISNRLLGKWLGTAFSLYWILTSYLGGATTLVYYMGNFITTQIMPETPEYTINIMFTGIVVMGLLLGLNTLARAVEVLFPVVIVLFCVLIVFVSPKIQIEHFLPVIDVEIKPFIKAVLSYISYTSAPVVFFLMIYPSSVRGGTKAAKALLIGNLLGGVLLLIITAVSVGVLGAGPTARQFYPSYALAKRINIGNFVTRIEVIVATFWIIGLYYKTAIYFYTMLKGTAQLFNVRSERVLALPLGLIMLVLSLICYPNSAYQLQWDERTWSMYGPTAGLIFPLVLLAVDTFRKKKKP